MARRKAERGPLVLITRPPGRWERLAATLAHRGLRVEHRPTIAVERPRDAEPARRAVAGLDRFDWVVFTSAHGARFFASFLAEHEEARNGSGSWPRVAVIGQATADAVERAGLPRDLVATDSRSEGLARQLAQLPLAGKRVLLVRPEVAPELLTDELTRAGALVEPVAFYRTVPDPGAGEVARLVAQGRYAVVVFSSPSTLHCLIDAAGDGKQATLLGLQRARRVAIGPTTSAAMEQQGLPADGVADAPTEVAIAEAVTAVLSRA